MPPELIGVIGVVAVFIFIFLGVPIGINLIAVGFVGLWVLTGFDAAACLLAIRPFVATATFSFLVMPLFILMGEFALHGGIGEDAYEVSSKWLGRFPGGLGLATTGGCALFGAVSGSSLAANSIFAKVALPEMQKYNYDTRFSIGCIAASGTLAVLIPPSSLIIVYGVLTETSIGKVLMGGYIPGIVSALIYMIMIFTRVKLNPRLVSVAFATTWTEKIKSLSKLWVVLLVAGLMLGGIFTGFFTPSEGAAFGATGTLIIALSRRRLTVQKFVSSLKETTRICAMILAIMVGAVIFGRFLAVSQISAGLMTLLTSEAMTPTLVMIIFLLVFGVMGMFLDPMGMMCLFLPIFLPVIEAFDINMVWFGILLVKCMELGGITPPLGLNVFAVKAAVGDAVPLEDIFRGIIPFALMDMFTITLLFAVPSIITWLPSMMW